MTHIDTFTRSQIAQQVDKISHSSVLKNSPVLRQFLQFVVDETLEGRGGHIKEYTIGTQVLGRKSDFDPQLDAIVRIHAGRLRRALNEFYTGTGKGDTLKISIPKGGYSPSFANNSTSVGFSEICTDVSGKSRRPVLAVMPFRNISPDSLHDFFCQGLGEFISTELARFQELSLVSYSSCQNAAERTKDIYETHSLLGAEYVLTGSIIIDHENLRILLQLCRGDSGKQLWSNTFMRKAAEIELFEIQEEIVNLIAATIGGYYGVIYRDLAEEFSSIPADEHDSYATLFWYDQFIRSMDANMFDRACDALERFVKKEPGRALPWAVLGEIYAVASAMGFRRIDKQLETAVQFSKRASNLDPLSQHAWQALAVSNLVARDKRGAIDAAEHCIALNPRAATYTAGMGGILVFAGQFERGNHFLTKSLLSNPFFPWMRPLALSLYHYHRAEYEAAKEWADKMEMPGVPWRPMLQAASLARLGEGEAAKNPLADLKQLVPDISMLGKAFIGSCILHEPLVDSLIGGLEKAGLVIADHS